MAVTRADVARRAGTSPALVSYVLNDGPRRVAPETRERILAAIEELGYRPNTVARSLRMARGHAIGLVIPDSANPYFALLARAVEETAHRFGYPLLVGNAADDERRELGYLRAFMDRQVEGVLAIPSTASPALRAEYAKIPTPVVLVDRSFDDGELPTVVADAADGAREVVAHLIGHGHTRIACLSGPEVSTSRDRVAGYERALAEAGLTGLPVLRRPFGSRAGYEALETLLAGPRPPTALFVTSDLAALGLLRAATDRGLRVPDDLAVASFDGIEYAAYTSPGLTTAEQPIFEMGRLAAELLVGALDSESRPTGLRTLPTRLAIRGSCGCADSFVRSSNTLLDRTSEPG